jgi:hypothetical protein
VHSQIPCSVQLLEARDLVAVARVTDEAHRLGERLRSEEVRIGLHRVALGDAAAAVDAKRLLVDHVHARLVDAVFLAVRRLFVAGLQKRIDAAELLPERLHVDDEVLDDRQVPHRGDHRHVTGLHDVVHPGLAREHCGAVHAHAARATDHHPAALAICERAVLLVLDHVEHVEQRDPLGRLELVLLERSLSCLGVEAPDLDLDLHGLLARLRRRFH